MKRISTLDGWRGIAICLVIANHAALGGSFEHQPWAQLGFLGVDIFFVVSGYIITSRLLEEQKQSSICLASFYQRRAFRILPLVFAYLGTLGVLSAFRNVDLNMTQVIGTLFFFRNYQVAKDLAGFSTSHFWSLSIEEQFYLAWPLLLSRLGSGRSFWVAVVSAFACGWWRVYDCAHQQGAIGRLLPGADANTRVFRTDLRLDGLLVGCALAILMSRPAFREFILKNFPKETPLICGTLMFFCFRWSGGLPSLTNYLLIGASVCSTLIVQEGLAVRWLQSRPLVWIGTISFSLYVWQQLLLFYSGTLHPLGFISSFPLNFAALFLVASCSFYFLEKPFTRMAKRLTSASHTGKIQASAEMAST